MSEELGKEMIIEGAKAIAVEGYKDTLHPALKAAGSVLALPFQAIDVALSKPKLWVAEKQYNFERTLQLIAKKMENTPLENIVPPDNYVAVPALQYISYCMDNDELRDMYANLLANSMNKVVKNGVHPGFVEIIKQLSPDEAKILRYMNYGHSTIPTISLRYEKAEGGGVTIMHNFSVVGELAQCEFPHETAKYFDNLCRLGLLDDVKGMSSLTDKKPYEPLKNHYRIMSLATVEQAKAKGYEKYDFEESIVRLTAYGKSFCSICLETKNVIVFNIERG